MPSRAGDNLLQQVITKKTEKDVDDFQDEETIVCDEQEICYGAGNIINNIKFSSTEQYCH